MNTDTKRHIDAARQVLVGVVPNPTSQIDQITNALIYKFMDDMDQAAVKAGGEPSFFVGDLEQYAWTRLMDTRMGNQERMNLYSEALLKFSEAKQLPELFRGIFKSAFLPYRSPETLGLFIKEINYFDYSHPEELGNAYEYLLSIMSSQGDAGQFRTPRHIIDFIVDVVNPTTDDKVLDPACGTGGFLVSSYKHILDQHDGKDDPDKKEKPLTPDQRRNLMNNFEGYDIDPGMVRIAQVNMYLHQFKNPKIYQYDSLSSDERWNDKFDVIMANPPFMSPKGGIKPHSKFSIQSSRSEVLFVDYIMNHLRPKGRAGIIVPEGIIFQTGGAHKQLRKNLVEDGLYAVVSLPSGVFAPYSGVKTSILLFNNELAKQSKEILFVKVSSDGFDLGAQRRISTKNDLPEALDILNKWNTGKKVTSFLAAYVEKTKIAENGDYNLSGGRYGASIDYTNIKWPSFTLRELEESGDITLGRGQVISKNDLEANPGIFPVYSSSAQGIGEFGQYGNYMFDEELITWSVDGGGRFFYRPKHKFSVTNVSGWLRINNPQKINAKYLFIILDTEWQDKSFDYVAKAHPSVIREMYKIPIPSLAVQEQIVTELGGYQSIITGANQIIANWKPKIDIDPNWPIVLLETVCEIQRGKFSFRPRNEPRFYGGSYPFIQTGDIVRANHGKITYTQTLNKEGLSVSKLFQPPIVVVTIAANIGDTAVLDFPSCFPDSVVGLIPKSGTDTKFLEFVMQTKKQHLNDIAPQAAQKNINIEILKTVEIPFPKIEVQKQIVEKIEAECILIESNKKLIEIYKQKIKEKLESIYGN